LDVRTIRLDELTIRRDEPEPALPSAPVQFAISAEKSKKAAGDVDRRGSGSTYLRGRNSGLN